MKKLDVHTGEPINSIRYLPVEWMSSVGPAASVGKKFSRQNIGWIITRALSIYFPAATPNLILDIDKTVTIRVGAMTNAVTLYFDNIDRVSLGNTLFWSTITAGTIFSVKFQKIIRI